LIVENPINKGIQPIKIAFALDSKVACLRQSHFIIAALPKKIKKKFHDAFSVCGKKQIVEKKRKKGLHYRMNVLHYMKRIPLISTVMLEGVQSSSLVRGSSPTTAHNGYRSQIAGSVFL